MKLKKIYALYTNIQGLVNNYNQLEIIATNKKFEFIILPETYFTENIEGCKITLQDYDHHIIPIEFY